MRLIYGRIFKEFYLKMQQIKYLTQQYEVRWACEFQLADLVVSNPKGILSALMKVSSNSSYQDAEHAEQAAGFCNLLMSGKVIVALVNLQKYLAELNSLSEEAQEGFELF